MMRRIKKIHMIGIGGSGMSGIAEVLINSGYEVSGSDMSNSSVVQHLTKLGARIAIGHAYENVVDAHVLVKSTAIQDENPEIQSAKDKNIPIIPRAEMLAELMRLRRGIAIAGTHGKTTTTSLTATIFNAAELDPTVIIGGRLNAYNANAYLGKGDYLIAEADESDASFLCLLPIINVVTNIDTDHLDFYPDQEAIDNAFIQFMNKVPFYGVNIVCGDDEGINRLLPYIKRPALTYGFNQNNILRAEILSLGESSHFAVYKKDKQGIESKLTEIELSHPGKHNILNALASIGVALESGIDIQYCVQGLKEFGGVGRRFEHKGKKNSITVIDDYGHHPVEIKATIATAKAVFPDKKIYVAFQPHRFSRTQALFGDFCTAFEGVEKLYLTEIYPASEKPIPGISSQSLAQGIKQVSQTNVEYAESFESLLAMLENDIAENSVFITLGAGNITQIAPLYLNS